MSDTTNSEPVIAPGGTDDPAPATPPAPPAPEPEPESPPAKPGETPEGDTPEEPKLSGTDKRLAKLTARLSAGEAERAQLRAELDRIRRGEPVQQPQAAQIPPEWRPVIDRAVAQQVEQLQLEAKMQAFHAAGRAEHADWNDMCKSLIDMGADTPLSMLLVDMPQGHKVAAALHEEPEELERIAALRSERARTLELGKFAARVEGMPNLQRPRAAAAAPSPIRPVTGSARVEPDPYRMDAQQAVAYYSKLDMESRRRK
jgi:hypothetical protein